MLIPQLSCSLPYNNGFNIVKTPAIINIHIISQPAGSYIKISCSSIGWTLVFSARYLAPATIDIPIRQKKSHQKL